MGSKDRLYADIMAVHPEVTGSCNLVIVKQPDNSTVKFVVDCGLFQERQYSKNNESSIWEKIPPGTSIVSWSGGFGFDIILFNERGTPRWTLQ